MSSAKNVLKWQKMTRRVRAVITVASIAVIGSIAVAIFAAPPATGCSAVCVVSPIAGSVQSSNFQIKTTVTPPSKTASYNEVVTIDADTEHEQVVDSHVQPSSVSGIQTYTFSGGLASDPSLFNYRLLSPGSHTITAELYSGTSPTAGALLGSVTSSFKVSSINNLSTSDEKPVVVYQSKLPYSGSTQPRVASAGPATLSHPRRDSLYAKLHRNIVPSAGANWPGNTADVVVNTQVINQYSGDVPTQTGIPNFPIYLGNSTQIAYASDSPTSANPQGYACSPGSQPITVNITNQDASSPINPGDKYGHSYTIYTSGKTGADGKITLSKCALNNIASEINPNVGAISDFTFGSNVPYIAGLDFVNIIDKDVLAGKYTNSQTFLDPYYTATQVFTYQYKPHDTDNDGVPDNQDKCPNSVGPTGSNGCPSSAFDPIDGPLIGLTSVANDHAVVDMFAHGLDASGKPVGLLKNISVTVDGKSTDTKTLTTPTQTLTDYSVNTGNIADGQTHLVSIEAYNNNGETISRLRYYSDPSSGPATADGTYRKSSTPPTYGYRDDVAYSASYNTGRSRGITVSALVNPDESKSYIGQTLSALGKVTVTATNYKASLQCSGGSSGSTSGSTGAYAFTGCPISTHKPPYYPKKYKLTATIPTGYHLDKKFKASYNVTVSKNSSGVSVATRYFILKKYSGGPAKVQFIFAKDSTTSSGEQTSTVPPVIPDTNPGTSGSFSNSAAVVIVDKINAWRAQHNLPSVTLAPNAEVNARMQNVARTHDLSEIKYNYFAHPEIDVNNPERCLGLADRIAQAGLTFGSDDSNPLAIGTARENIAYGDTNANTYDYIQTAWQNSPGHNANMLATDVKYIAVASIEHVDGYAGTSFTGSGDSGCPTKETPEYATNNNVTLITTIFWSD